MRQMGKQVAEIFDARRIESVSRFVENHNFRVVQQRLRHAEPLFHTEGIRFELFLDAVLHAHHLYGFADTFFVDAAGTRVQPQIFIPGQVRIHIRVFHNAADAVHRGLEIPFDVMAHHLNGTAVRGEQAEDHFDSGGFAGAVGAEKTENLAGLYREADILHHHAFAEGFADVLEF